jgi:hypothetical protein
VCIHAQDVDNTTNGVVYLWGITFCPTCGSGKRWGPIEFNSVKEAQDKAAEIAEKEAEIGRSCHIFVITSEPPPPNVWPPVPNNDKGSDIQVLAVFRLTIRDAYGRIWYDACCVAFIRGDAHYITYDGAKINFQGTCSYYLSAFGGAPGKGLPTFQIIGKNDHPMPRMKTRSVLVATMVFFGNLEINFLRDGTVLIDGTETNDEYTGDGFRVVPGSDEDKFVADNGISLTYNGSKMSATVTMPVEYKGLIVGMLGNYNGDAADDIRDADGNPQPDGPHGHCLIGNSYQVEPEEECSFDCP